MPKESELICDRIALRSSPRRFGAHGWLLLLLLVVSGPALSQENLAQLAERQRRIADDIERIESERGPQARELIEPLTALSLLYEEMGEYRFADPTIERLLQVIRANYGLYSLEQIPSIRLLMVHELERGNAVAAWELEQGMLGLAERNPEDLRTARILRDTADRRMDLLERYNAGAVPAEIVLGCYYMETVPTRRVDGDGLQIRAHGTTEGSCTSGSRRRVRENLAAEAQSYYAQAINVLLANEDYSSGELPTLLMDLADSSYRYSNPALGRRSLRYLLAYQTTNSAPLLDRVDTLVQIADWGLLYSDGSRDSESALAEYEAALALLDDAPAAREWVDQAFSPDVPIRLPAFYPNSLATTEQGAIGHIDVAFVIDTHGRSRRVRILDTTSNAPESAQKRLKQLIERSRFRPQLVEGQFADTDTIVLRYYLHE